MGLVDYEESDASSNESDQEETVQNVPTKRKGNETTSSTDVKMPDRKDAQSVNESLLKNLEESKEGEKGESSNKLFVKLPKPHEERGTSRLSTFGSSFGDLVKAKTGAGRIQILAPTFAADDDDSDISDDESPAKKPKVSSSGTGSFLTSLLPKPKNAPSSNGEISTQIATATSLVPHAVSRSKPQLPKPVHKTTTASIVPRSVAKPNMDPEEEGTGNDFFSLSDTSKRANESITTSSTISAGPSFSSASSRSSTITANPHQEEPTYSYIRSSYVSSAPSTSRSTPTPSASASSSASMGAQYSEEPLDVSEDVTLKKKIYQKFGEETADDIQIIDVNVNQHINSSNEWLKNISQESDEQYRSYKGAPPTGAAKRKHQITYLAFQAKQRELELKNEWAKNKITKAQTRAKYGF